MAEKTAAKSRRKAAQAHESASGGPGEAAASDDAPEGAEAVSGAVVEERPEDFAPAARDLVIADPGDRTGVLVVIDHHDEVSILANLQTKLGKQLGEKLLYKFRQGGKDVIELSVSGVFECVWEMNATGKVNVQVDRTVKPVFEDELIDTDFAGAVPHVTCTVFARDERTGIGAYGTFSQPRLMKLRAETVGYRKKDKKFLPEPNEAGDYIISDPFARQKALNKAERNALRKLVPEFVAQTLIAMRKGDPDAVRQIEAGAGAEKLADLPAPLDTDEAKALRGEIEGLYRELREVNPQALLPAAFNEYLTRTAHDLERMGDFREHVASLLEGEREKSKAAAK